MKSISSKIWFPLAVAGIAAAHTLGSGISESPVGLHSYVQIQAPVKDTVIYPHDGYRQRWTEEDYMMDKVLIEGDSLYYADSLSEEALLDTIPAIMFKDTVKVPDSLKFTDPFRYKYYAALVDSFTHRWVRDTLIAAGDSLDWPKLDSLYASDSVMRAKLEFERWYASLSKTDRKKYEMEQKSKVKLARMDSISAVKDSIKHIRDSIAENTPRILATTFLPDSLQTKRIITWTHSQEFHQLDPHPVDTGFNYRFHDYPFKREDVNATWLGVAGSPLQHYNYFKRDSREGISFYDALESWSFSPSTLPMYNTKTPYTELAYWGSLLSGTQKESDNIHILTSQNIYPEWNYTLAYDRFGGNGILTSEATTNKNVTASVNRLSNRHLLHAGYIYNMVSRNENGGIVDNTRVRDTTVDAREINIALEKASSLVKKNTVFLDQQYRIPFTFINDLKARRQEKELAVEDEKHYRDSIAQMGEVIYDQFLQKYLREQREKREEERARLAAEKGEETDITTAFIGHSTEYSTYRRTYTDDLRTNGPAAGRALYNNVFNINPNSTADSMRVMKFENRAFIRLQPWAEEAVVSKLDLGLGNRLLSWYSLDPSFIRPAQNERWNSTYIYAGAEGQLRNSVFWSAGGDYVFLGHERNDLSVKADAGIQVFPFRRARKSPVTFKGHFETVLDEPGYYEQHVVTNHYKWDNDFSKVSSTKLRASIDVPRYDVKASVGYALLANNIFYDSLGIVRQNTTPMSVLTADLEKNFTIGNFLHFDHRALFQLSSNQDVLPLPKLALNFRYYAQLNIEHGIMLMQIGADGYWNTAWYSPAWNPALGVFHNQTEEKYNNGPYLDAFVNIQWKRACIFVKLENAGQGWLTEKNDYFSAHHYINTQRTVKVGIYWPFYTQPRKLTPSDFDSSASRASSQGVRGGASSGRSVNNSGVSRARN